MDGQLTKSPKKSAVLQTLFVMRYAEVLSPCIEAMLSVTRQRQYQQNRLACGRHLDNLEKEAFLAYVDSHIREDKWSLDACVGRALQSGEFVRCELVCTKTLYRYVDLGLMGTRNHNLLEKLKRNTKAQHIRKNKKKLGRSIEERPKEVENRT